jgi:integrase/recombinase XerC
VTKTSSVNKTREKPPLRVLSWGDHVTRFAASLDTLERSPKTIQAYQGELARFAAWFRAANDEEPSIQGITGSDLLEFKRAMIERECQPPTVNRAIAAVKTFLQWGRADLPEIPKRIRKAPDELRWLDPAEQRRLLRVIEQSGNKRDLAITRILIDTGLRVAELVALEWRDVQISERKGSIVVRFGKGAKWRTIPRLRPITRDAFTVLKAGNEPDPRARVFQGPRGPIGTRAVQHMLSKYAPGAKLEPLTPHMLRHTFCKNLVRAGVGLPEIARLAGHSSILTTQRYVTPSADDLERAMDRLGADDPAR